MDSETLLKSFRKRLVLHGVLKSAVWGVTAGCGALFIVALVTWICGTDGGIWIAVGLGAGVAVAVSVLCYFLKFRPTEKYVAQRVDALGLEERTVTMLEYGDDASYIAERQRIDANAAIKAAASSAKFKLIMQPISIATACASSVLGGGMGIVNALAENGVIPAGKDLVDPARANYYEIIYLVDGDGEIDGEDVQILQPGEKPTPVMAVAADGWVFVGWDDNLKNPYRWDSKLNESAIFTAVFSFIDEEEDDKGENGDGPDGDGDSDPDTPDGSGGQADGGEGDGSGDKGDGDGKGDGGENGDNQGGSGQGTGAGFKYEQKNQILDGETYYGDEIENYRRKLEEKLANNEDLTDEERRFIELYFGSL